MQSNLSKSISNILKYNDYIILTLHNNILYITDDFMFQLNQYEFDLIFQNGTSSWGGTRKLPYAFTEHGVTMLAGLLNSIKAIEVNIQIVRAFVTLRQFALGYTELNQKLETFMIETNMQFNDIYQALTELASRKEFEDRPRNKVGFVRDK